MSKRRIVLPGCTYLITRRTTRRHFLLQPDRHKLVEQLFWYCTAYAAKKTGVIYHSVQVLSNHIHEVVTDVHGCFPTFLEYRNRLLAQAIKCLRGWPEEVFSKASTSCQSLENDEAIVQSIGYVTANCVEAGLVQSPHEWPGAKVLVPEIGVRIVRVKRPDVYFSPTNPEWPEELELAIHMPKQLMERHGSLKRAQAVLQQEVDRQVGQARAEHQRAGRTFAGRNRVLNTSHYRRASTAEVFGSRLPTFKAGGDIEVAARAVARLREFNERYDEAWARWRDKDRRVRFPAGTWKMWRQHGASRDAPPVT